MYKVRKKIQIVKYSWISIWYRSQEIFLALCLMAVVMALPTAEDLEAEQPLEQFEADPNFESDLEGAESRYGGFGRRYGGGYGKKRLNLKGNVH